MDGTVLASVMFAVLIALIALRMPIAIALFLVGAVGMVNLTSFDQLLIWLEAAPVGRTASYSLSVIPIFVLMGQLALHSGLSRDIVKSCVWADHAAARSWRSPSTNLTPRMISARWFDPSSFLHFL